jgi:glycosyltransferase involved in cell wall biosynthesis
MTRLRARSDNGKEISLDSWSRSRAGAPLCSEVLLNGPVKVRHTPQIFERQGTVMHIAQIAPPWLQIPPVGYGGVERLVGNLTEGLVARGHEVTLFAPHGSRTQGRLVSPLEHTPLHDDPGRADNDMFYMLSAYLAADQFDVIHDHTQSRIGSALGAMLGGYPPVVHTLHSPWTPVRRRFFGQVDDRIHIVASSKSQARLNPDIRYAAMIYDGIDLDAHPLGDEKEDYLIFLGRCSSEKAPDIALDVARAADTPLVMVLKRSERAEWEFFEHEVRPRLRECDRVIEQPPHADKIRLLQRARATLFPIRWEEPFGQVMAESMACGTPVIAMRRGAASDLVVDGETGFVCDTPEQMSDAVRAASDLSPQACREHVSATFSSKTMVEKYERLYASLVARQA